jgi:hypothetical protein
MRTIEDLEPVDAVDSAVVMSQLQLLPLVIRHELVSCVVEFLEYLADEVIERSGLGPREGRYGIRAEVRLFGSL